MHSRAQSVTRGSPSAMGRGAEAGALFAIVVLGVFIRIPAFTSFNPWFDDAWAMMPAKVGLRAASHMVVTTPLYTFAMREWLMAGSGSTMWAQIPGFVFGVGGIVAIWATLRFFGASPILRLLGALVIAVGPVTSIYSMRVKEYAADLLFACLILVVFERWRRQPALSRIVVFALVSMVAIATSASTVVVVAACGLTGLLCTWARRELVVQILVAGAMIGAGLLVVYALWFRHIPPTLTHNWRGHGYLFDYRSSRLLAYTALETGSGFIHGLFGIATTWVPTAPAFPIVTIIVAILGIVLLIALVVFGLAHVVTSKFRQIDQRVAPALVMGLAYLLCLADRVPFGTGRTDEVLYPAFLVLCAAALRAAATQLKAIAVSRRATALGALAAVVLVAFGATHLAVYPQLNLTGLVKKLTPSIHSGDLVVVDGANSFTWGYEGITATRVAFVNHGIPWPQGFHIASLNPTIVMSRSYLQPDEQFATLAARTKRIWYIGYTNETAFSTAAPRDLWDFEVDSDTKLALLALGWKPATYPINAIGTYATLFVHS